MSKANKKVKVVLILLIFLFWQSNLFASSIRGHLINTGKNLIEAIFSPLKGVLIYGPKNIKEAYNDEVWEREKIEKRGRLKYRFIGLWRAPGEEAKGIIKGVVETVEYTGRALWEFISIVWLD